MKKEFLYNDLATYQRFKSKEDNLFKIFNELKEISKRALGETEIDYKKYLENPSGYLVEMYWEIFANVANHLSDRKAPIFETHTNIRIQSINDLHRDFRQSFKAMQSHAPTITTKGLKSILNKDNFNRYLDPKKADQYHVLKRLVDAANELKKYQTVYAPGLVRFCDDLRWVGLEVEINNSKFQL